MKFNAAQRNVVDSCEPVQEKMTVNTLLKNLNKYLPI